jgi:pimeloyl-ACP methyl ester carboxylesterase/UDP:flavonoid glycosyltransferase YjiC (YdhE family)
MRAREPDESGYAVNDGVRIYYEVFGTGSPTILLLPTLAIVTSRHWKAQVPYLARHYRVVTFDPRGNGKSDRPVSDGAYDDDAMVSDVAAVLAATGTESAVLAGMCAGVRWASLFAAEHPERVLGLFAIAANIGPLAPPHPHQVRYPFDDVLDTDEGWAKKNRHYWRRDYRGWLEFHSGELCAEPHSTKLVDDLIEWGLETDEETLARVIGGAQRPQSEDEAVALCQAITCPVLVLHGTADQCQPPARSERFAELTGGRLVMIDGAGHVPHGRHPVFVNRLFREFVDSIVPPSPRHSVWLRAAARKRRVLWISSPIGLGHTMRDLAIARSLRAAVPDVEIHWWTQHPVTKVLETAGEIVHPVSSEMASESAHWESQATTGHDLHAFDAFRRMDEIFCANYMLFDDVVRESSYDLWVGDESWEVDYFLHENPERKIAPYAFLTDVIGFLPVDPDGDPREAALCADYNAEMIEQRARFPRLRDLSLYIGSYDELPDASFGPGLPEIRDWTRSWFEPVPYVLPFDLAAHRDPAAARTRLGHGTGFPLLFASAGGTTVGRNLLRLIAEGFARLQKEMPEARMVMVTGPRIDPRELPDVEGLEKRGYVHNLYEHLAAADAAVVQGGLSTTMELVALRRPFVYFPIGRHWEQRHHVAHRLKHYRAGIQLDYATTTPSEMAAAMRSALGRTPRYRAVPEGGARQAAVRMAQLLVR